MEPRSRASPEQFSVLIDFMERYGDLLRPQRGPQGRIKCDQLWRELTNILNSVGGGVHKSLEKWKKVWADWKTKTKKKSLCQRQQASGTGGGPSSKLALTRLEERVLAVIGTSAVVGQAGIREQGFNTTSGATQRGDNIVIEDHGINMASASVITSHAYHSDPQSITPHMLVTTSLTLASPSPPPSQRSPPPPPRTPPPSTSRTPPRSPPRTPPPPPPRTPSRRSSRQQAALSPLSSSTNSRRVLSRARRNRGLTPFERAADQFAAVEQRRLQYEEARDKRLHEREMERNRLEAERLRQEAERIKVAQQHNSLLHQLSLLGQRLVDVIMNTQQPAGSLPSTDSI